MFDCEICGIGPGCLCTIRECPDYYFPASKEQVIDRLKRGVYKNHRDNMREYLKDAFGIVYPDYSEVPGDVDETFLADKGRDKQLIDTAQSRYDKSNRVAYSLRLNKKTDADVIARLEEVKDSENGMQGYIKRLIRQDIKKD